MIAIPHQASRTFRGKPIPAVTILHHLSDDVFFGIPAIRFDLEIVTGVMHQIRVHLQSLGFALIGHPIYEKPLREPEVRLGLHARQIHFTLRNRTYDISSPLP